MATPVTAPAGNSFLLYFSWQGLQLIHPVAIGVQAATPGVFVGVQDGNRVTLYATGLGALTGTLGIGEFVPSGPVLPATNPVSVTIGGQEAEVEFAGGAPGLLGGVYQINAVLPEGLAAGRYPVVVTVAGQSGKAYEMTLR